MREEVGEDGDPLLPLSLLYCKAANLMANPGHTSHNFARQLGGTNHWTSSLIACTDFRMKRGLCKEASWKIRAVHKERRGNANLDIGSV